MQVLRYSSRSVDVERTSDQRGCNREMEQESERMIDDDLKPCPFCGAKAMLVYCVHGVGANWGVECTETHAHRMEFGGTQDEVIKEWNRRAKE